MAYRLKIRNSPEEEVKRIMHERIDDSIDRLGSSLEHFDDTTHEVRKNMKKIRGLLKLFRDSMPDGSYRELNRFYRDFSRRFAAARDARVFRYTLEWLNRDDPSAVNIREAIDLLTVHHEKVLGRILRDKDWLTISHMELQASKQKIDRLQLGEPIHGMMQKGLKRVFGRGRKAMDKAKASSDGERLHEWRKRAKYLWYHMRLLQDAWPEVVKGYIKELDKLSGELGLDHDLFELKRQVKGSEVLSTLPEKYRKDIAAVIDMEREAVQSRLWPLGDRIYLEKPGRFSSRMIACWKATEQLQQ